MKIFVVTITVCCLVAALLCAGCASSNNTASPTPIPIDAQLATYLNSYFAGRHALVDNFTLNSNVSAGQPRLYTGAIQDNGTLFILNIFLANSTNESRGQFNAQMGSYAQYSPLKNGTVIANTSSHWAAASHGTTVDIWQVDARSAGPYGLTLDSPYVLVSVGTVLGTRSAAA